MQSSSTILQPYITYPPAGAPLFNIPVLGITVIGSGYYKSPFPLHTVQYSTAGSFTGMIIIQGSLASFPDDANGDWYNIPETLLGDGVTPVTDNTYIFNFSGNHVWIRSNIKLFTQGTVSQILYMHN